MQNKIYLSLGSNEGDRLFFLKEIIRLLDAFSVGTIYSLSKVYESTSWGYEDESYLNMCLSMDTHLMPYDLLSELQKIEQMLGRKRKSTTDRGVINYSARTVDIDILFYNALAIQTSKLTIPHPLLHQRRFVLEPLCDIAASFIHPTLGKSIQELRNVCKDEGRVSFWGEIFLPD